MESTTTDQSLTSWTFLGLLRKAVQIYLDNVVTFVGLTLVVTVPLAFISQVLLIFNIYPYTGVGSMSAANSSQAVGTVCMAYVAVLIVTVLQLVLTYGPIVYGTAESLMGRKLTIGQALNERRGRYLGLGIGFIFFYIVVGAFSTLITLFTLMLNCSPVLAAFGIVVYMAAAAFTMLAPVLILENISAVSGVNRAGALGRMNFWKNFGVVTLVIVLTNAAQFAIVALTQSYVSQNGLPVSPTMQLVQSAVNAFFGIFLVPFIPIVLTLLYFDTRIRFEGLAVALQTLDKPNARTWDVAAPIRKSGLQGKDWRNIAILIVGALVLALLFGTALSSWVSSMTPVRGLPL
ncbi:MAG: hypothetical protein IT320_17410 [Anaerolineae bacterium]|nr:hypothetical protein [Anaerolineae bacterium]